MKITERCLLKITKYILSLIYLQMLHDGKLYKVNIFLLKCLLALFYTLAIAIMLSDKRSTWISFAHLITSCILKK